MRWLFPSFVLCFSATVQAEPLCGSGSASDADVKMLVHIDKAEAGKFSPLVMVDAPNQDKSYTLLVSYRPTETGLGSPAKLHVKALVPYPAQGEPEPHQIEWRSTSGKWVNPGFWATPQRWSPKEDVRGKTNYPIAQGNPFPSRTEMLDELGRGARYEFRSLDRDGNVVSSGSVEYPDPQRINRMYEVAKAKAVANLKPCGPPAAVIRPYEPQVPSK